MKSFAVADGRDTKAAKIEAVLCSALGVSTVCGRSILDLGAGSGHIAAHFASNNSVTAADAENQMRVSEGRLAFVKVAGTTLPFEDSSFEIVILNHVLTYIEDQVAELREVRRVLKAGGICYIALPNRLFPIDPHSKLPFVHYFPRSLHEQILAWMTGARETIRMHSLGGMLTLFAEAGFKSTNFTNEVLHDPVRYRAGTFLRLPKWRWLSRASPTNIFILEASSEE